MTLLIIYLLLALVISFLCSIVEAALLSTPMTFIKANEKSKSSGLKKISRFKKDVDRPLSAILSLNTIAHTVGAAGVGAQASIVFGEAYFGLVSAILTILILVLTEIIPKTIGAKYWKSLINFTGNVISFMIIITYPLVLLSAVLTRLISKNKTEQTTSREEISALAEIGTNEGVFQDKENKIIQNLIKLKHVRVSEIMTPRTVATIVHEEMTLEEFLKNKEYLRFSRIPVYSENQDNITGYIFRQKVFEKLAEDHDNLTLKDLKVEIVIVPDTTHVFSLWEQLLEKKEHIALVVNEYGGMDGIVTMEDIIETLVGFEIVDEKDTISDMQQFAKERWQQRQAKYKLLNTETTDKQ
jgi:CBS domain containing-hemolysin-like protein